MEANAQIFRSLNERILARAGRGLEIVCECEAEACTERVLISHVEFYEVRRHRGWFVVRPGHDLPEVDRVIAAQPAFLVVEKASAAA